MKKWQNNTLYLLLCITIGMIVCGCAAKKKIAEATPAKAEKQAPAWHTTSVPNAEAKVSANKQSLNADCQMAVVRDSMLTISIMPMLGIEMLRVEATPDSICVIDKINRRYAVTDYKTINQVLTPHLTWATLQEMASGEKITDNDWKSFTYTAMGYSATISLRYNTIRRDEPVRVNSIKTSRYTRIDPKTFLQ